MAVREIKLSQTGAKEILPERLQAMVGCRIPLPSQHAGRIVVTAQGTREDGRRGEMGRVLERHADIGTVTKEMLSYMVDGGLKNPVCSVTYVSDKWFPQLNDHYRTAVGISIEEKDDE